MLKCLKQSVVKTMNKLSISVFTQVSDGDVVQVLDNVWAWCDQGDKTKMVATKNAPVINRHKNIVQKWAPRVQTQFPNAKLILVERVFKQWDTTEYIRH